MYRTVVNIEYPMTNRIDVSKIVFHLLFIEMMKFSGFKKSLIVHCLLPFCWLLCRFSSFYSLVLSLSGWQHISFLKYWADSGILSIMNFRTSFTPYSSLRLLCISLYFSSSFILLKSVVDLSMKKSCRVEFFSSIYMFIENLAVRLQIIGWSPLVSLSVLLPPSCISIDSSSSLSS